MTGDHVHRVQAYALGLARALGVHDQETLQAIEAAGCCTTPASSPCRSTS